MFCSRCGRENRDGSRFCTECGESLVSGTTVRPEGRHRPSAARDQDPAKNLVYPKNPPLSPHLCWLNLILPGVAQLILGQAAKGIAIFFLASFALGFFGEESWMVVFIAVAATFEAYRVGTVLRSGRAVAKWQFFP